jgi:hypothetical protein
MSSIKTSRVKPDDRVLEFRPEVKWRAELDFDDAYYNEMLNTVVSHGVVGYGATRKEAIAEAERTAAKSYFTPKVKDAE